MGMRRFLLLVLLLAAPLSAQRDFLTADEADQLRLAETPDDRIKAYLTFARVRMDMIDQAMSKEKAGRSGFVHDTLEELSKVVEAMDTAIDDYLKHGKSIASLETVSKTQREIAAKLEKILESGPKDLERYRFSLTQAIEVAQDSAEMAEQDLKDRKRTVITRDQELQKERESMMTPAQREEAKKEQAKKDQEAINQKKKPSLLRKGETVKGGDPNKQD
jgi:hypothetical protein